MFQLLYIRGSKTIKHNFNFFDFEMRRMKYIVFRIEMELDSEFRIIIDENNGRGENLKLLNNSQRSAVNE